MSNLKSHIVFSFAVLFLASLVLNKHAYANHSWGSYHWARTSNPFTLKLGDNLTAVWDVYLATSSYDWSLSSVLNTAIVPGRANPKNCRPTGGQIEVCNSKYGNNGWLGIAQIWVNGDHIFQGVAKVNDTYFNTAKYNTSAWKNLVMCQEVGHNFGLDHQDEIFDNTNLGTCMDYTNNPSTNQHPNQHDYDQLEDIYTHLDSFTTVGQTTASVATRNFDSRGDWGKEIRNNGHTAVYERNFGLGHKLFTFVVWAQE